MGGLLCMLMVCEVARIWSSMYGFVALMVGGLHGLLLLSVSLWRGPSLCGLLCIFSSVHPLMIQGHSGFDGYPLLRSPRFNDFGSKFRVF
jgi:hypothetical protein